MSRRHDRREQIARAAVEPMVRLGVHAVTLADVGSAIGMSGANLLYYFDSKTDLFMTALRLIEEDLRARVLEAFEHTESARRRWELVLEYGAPSGLDDSGLLLWLAAWSEAPHDPAVLALITELEAAWQGLLADTLRYAVERGELPPTIDAAGIAEAVSALLDGLTIRIVVGYRPVDRDTALRIVDDHLASRLAWRAPTPTEGEQ